LPPAGASGTVSAVNAKTKMIAALAAATLALTPGVAGAAAAGDLDPTFDGDGKQAFPFVGVANEALVQPDGKIVLAGIDANLDFAVWRLTPDGALDRSFSGDGVVAISFGSQDEIKAAALQPDGKIVVAGTTQSTPTVAGAIARLGYDMAIARLNPDGTRDKTFNPGGRDGDGAKVFRTEEDAWATAVAVQPYDGAIVLAGYTTGTTSFSLRRLDSTGAVDATVFENPPGLRDEYLYDTVVQPNGSIVVAGQAAGLVDSRTQAMVARYTPQGSLDETFAGTGIKQFPEVRPQEVLVRPDGTLVVAGSDYDDDLDSWITVTQLTAAGQLFKAFGDGGTARIDFAGAASTTAAVLQPDGKVVVVGALTPGSAFAVARLDASGAPDAAFGSAGKATIAFGDYNHSAATALQPDGGIVVAGVTATNNVPQLAAARLLGEPTPPPSGSQNPVPAKTPRCGGRRATIVGTARRDTLRGTRRADVIVALGGNDTVLARGGNDVVCGGAGSDRLNGGPGRDVLTGGAGRDRCIGAAGRDRAAGCERRRSL
jgi:uncharacterized delta-60 repeat protein